MQILMILLSSEVASLRRTAKSSCSGDDDVDAAGHGEHVVEDRVAIGRAVAERGAAAVGASSRHCIVK